MRAFATLATLIVAGGALWLLLLREDDAASPPSTRVVKSPPPKPHRMKSPTEKKASEDTRRALVESRVQAMREGRIPIPDSVGRRTAPGRPPGHPRLVAIPRPKDEWQGRLMRTTNSQSCKTRRCTAAMACIEGVCTGCTEDSDCEANEVCALDHCALPHLTECKSRKDCADGELCVLDGFGSNPRHNDNMRVYCKKHTRPTPPQRRENK